MNPFPIFIAITIFTYSCPYSLSKPTDKAGNKVETKMNPDTMLVKDCPEQVNLRIGQTYTLKLPAIEGTGYLWIPKSSPLLSWTEEEKYEKRKIDSTSDNPQMVGSPTLQILTLKGLIVGKDQIIIEYVRPFGTRKPEKICQFKLHVIN
jgi:predicted secreted protein